MRTLNERSAILASSLGHFFSHYAMLIFPALAAPLAAELHRPLPDVLAAAFLGALLYGLGALPAGLGTDRFGARPLLFLGLAGSALGCLAAAAARDLPELGLALAGIGAASSLYHPAGTALVTRAVREAGSALGTVGIFGNLGIALAPIMTGALTALWGWRTAYLVAAAAQLLTALLVLLVRPEDSPGQAEPREEKAGEAPNQPRFLVSPLALGLIACALAAAGIGFQATAMSWPAFFEDQDRSAFLLPAIAWLETLGLHIQTPKTLAATALTSFAYGIAMLGQVLGGKIADRTELRGSYLAFHALSIPFLALLWVLPAPALVLAAAGYSFFAIGMQPIENSLVARLGSPRRRGLLFGAKFGLSFGIGALAVALAAVVARRWGLSSVFLLGIGSAFTTLLFAALFRLATRDRGELFQPAAETRARAAASKTQQPLEGIALATMKGTDP